LFKGKVDYVFFATVLITGFFPLIIFNFFCSFLL